MKKEKENFSRLIKFLSLSLIILSLVRIIITIYGGNQVLAKKQLIQEKEEIEEENRRLKKEVAQKTSFTFLAARAQEKGFAKPQKIIYLPKEIPLALKSQ